MPAEPMSITDHELAPWEKRCHATLECLAWRKVISTEEKRRAIEDMGQSIYGSLTYYEKWALAAAHQLVEKGLITQDQLDAKRDEIRSQSSVEP